MLLHNSEIADYLNEIADYLEIKGENQFRIRSYRNAANTISGLTENVTEMAENKSEIQSLPDIGESMADKIIELSKTGHLSQLDKLKKEIPKPLNEIMKLEQMGPQRTITLYEKLNIESVTDLKKAAKEGKIEELEGFGKKSTEKILKEIDKTNDKDNQRLKLHDAGETIAPMLEYLEKKIDELTITGSYRRMKETVGDIDLLGTARDAKKAMAHFVNYDEVKEVLSKGKTRSSVKLRTNLQVDIRIVEKKSLGAAKLYFTGSKSHTIALRKIGQSKDYKVNEYGIYKGDKQIAGKTEKEMYKTLGMDYIEPELRENNGEIEAAQKNQLPDLIKLTDIRGDLHMHTKATDGKYTLEEMAKAAQQKGYEYIAITDHSKKVTIANGLDRKRLEAQIEEIDEINSKMKNIRILKGIEADILEDGTLDMPDEILKELDIVVCSIHYNMKLSAKKQTRRILKAMENPYFNILAHPTGRMINKRSGYDYDIGKIIKEAVDNGCYLEINGNPDRLDLNDLNIRQAKEAGLKLAISTDSHSVGNLEYMKYGVSQARRGWMEKESIINTRSWKELKNLLKRD